jgi:hypothetical protein
MQWEDLMSGTHGIHVDILNDAQREVIAHVGRALAHTDFYLAGGTAAALQIGHRSSMHLDWFIDKLGDPEILFRRLKSYNIAFEIQSVSPETVYLTVNTVEASFMGYDYPLIQPKVFWPDHGIHLAGLDDIACMKLSAIALRGSRKDFVDLHYLITHVRPLEDYLQLYIKKFKNRDIGHVVRSLVYFADAEGEPALKMIKPVIWQDLKSDFEQWVKDLSSHYPLR